MCFFDIVSKQCVVAGVSVSRMLTDLQMSRGSIGKWKGGVEPTNRTKKQIADYFGITVDELMSGQKEKPADQKADELTEDEKLLLKLFNALSPEDQELALGATVKPSICWHRADIK